MTAVNPASALPPSTASRQTIWALAGVLVLAAAAAFSNSFAGAFVYDDLTGIVENPTIRHLWPPGTVLSPPPTAGTGGRPVANFSLALSYALGGGAPWGFHALNLLIHALGALALFGVVRRTLLLPALRPRFGPHATMLAFTIALLWAVHPLSVSVVTYLSQRTEELMALFYLLTLYCFLRAADGAPRRWLPLAVASCWLGMASKEVMVTAPVLVFWFDRTFVAGSWRAAWRMRWRFHLSLAAAWIAPALLAGVAVALRRAPAVAFLDGSFFLLLAPTSSVVPIVFQPIAENRCYLPLAAAVTGLVLGLHTLLGRRAAAVGAGLAAAWGALAFQRDTVYVSELSV